MITMKKSKMPEIQKMSRLSALQTVKDLSSDYTNIGIEIGELVTEKNQAYGDSFNQSEKIIAVLYPNGVPKEGYTDFLTIVRVIDKLFRIATDRDALGESPWRDIAGYSLLAIERQERNKKNSDATESSHLNHNIDKEIRSAKMNNMFTDHQKTIDDIDDTLTAADNFIAHP